LYFRLRSVNVHLPALRDRKEDIPALVEFYVREISEKNKLHFAGFTDDAAGLLMEYRWPGNIRELKNALESMLVLEKGRRMNAENVRKYLREQMPVVGERNLPVFTNKSVEQAERELIYRALLDLKSNIIEMKEMIDDKFHTNGDGEHDKQVLTMNEMERRMIQGALERNKGNRRLAARELHISERTLYRKIHDFGLE
jgi:DNA-binding NtrC family response regulator